jgi:hypothetical protein
MTERILGPTHSRRRRRFLLVPTLMVALAALFLVAGAQAVHDANVFQLEGNAQTAGGPAGTEDWDLICKANPSSCTFQSGVTPPAGTTTSADNSFVSEPDRSTSIFTGGGSKDPNDISAWKGKDQGGLPDKDNLRDSFAARYSVPPSADCPSGGAATCELLYFGMDRFDNSGDAQNGFWFLQNKVAFDSVAGTFSGVHEVGDLLVLSDFSNGGDVSTIAIFEWVGTGGDTNGTLDFVDGGTAALCGGAAHDSFCGIVNPVNGTIAPWLFTDKSGNNTYLNGEFYEAGINLSALGFAGQCFASVVTETRASTSPTATLKDFTVGQLGECKSDTVTTPQTGAGDPIPADGLSIGTGSVTVRDHAEVTVAGVASFDGNVTFFLCGPLALDSTSNCATGGVQIGSPVPVMAPSPATANSAVTTLTSVGRYCWRAVYSGDEAAGVPGSSDPEGPEDTSTTECFKVNPVTPTLTTDASDPVSLGNPISDTATLSGTANAPGTNGIGPGGTINATNGAPANGTISFTAFGPNNCTTTAFGPVTRAVSGDATYPTAAQPAVSFIPTAVGTYTWVASYSGDSPNTNAVPASACPDPTGTETVLVTDTTSTSTAQNWLPNDSATIGSNGGSALSGSVTFTLYNNGTCDPGVGGANVLYTEGPIAVSGSSPQTRSTNNTTIKVLASATVSWRAVYTSDNPNVGGSSSTCETTVLTITN